MCVLLCFDIFFYCLLGYVGIDNEGRGEEMDGGCMGVTSENKYQNYVTYLKDSHDMVAYLMIVMNYIKTLLSLVLVRTLK